MDEKSAILPADSITQVVQDLPRLIERMHRRYLDVVRIELSRHGFHDISPVQAVMLGTIGGPTGMEEISVRDLIERGYYLGSNASYNLKSLVDGSYVERKPALRDRRSARLRLSDKGRGILALLTIMNLSMAEELLKSETREIEIAYVTLRHFERRWTEAIRSEE
ncbi:MAG: MarR family transcriptional regulator [Alphaproteobacteria bacterium]|nr:MarR family transcriptional regulator [Alphaproteobacteria bacterium]